MDAPPTWSQTPEGVEHSPALPRWYLALPPGFRRLAPPLTAAGLLISLGLHIAFLLVAAIWYVGGGGTSGQGAQAGGAGGPIGVAVMTSEEFAQLSGDAALDTSAPVSEIGAPTTADSGDRLGVEVDSLSGANLSTAGVGEGLGAESTGFGAGDIGDGSSLGTGGGSGGGAASFFGVEARGTRFAYVIDVSGSMAIGVGGDGSTTRMDLLRGELERSVRALPDRSRFSIILFSTGAEPLGKRAEWTSADDSGKGWARRNIALLKPDGDTQPSPGFQLVFKLRPRPDAIYFMTDGEFDQTHADTIAELNGSARIPIHCITFISEEGRANMQRIAAQSGGTYTHVGAPGAGGTRP